MLIALQTKIPCFLSLRFTFSRLASTWINYGPYIWDTCIDLRYASTDSTLDTQLQFDGVRGLVVSPCVLWAGRSEFDSRLG